jgi:hypothetical protein
LLITENFNLLTNYLRYLTACVSEAESKINFLELQLLTSSLHAAIARSPWLRRISKKYRLTDSEGPMLNQRN